MEHSDFQELTPAATKVLMVLACQYNGRNNGDLAATHTMLTRWSGMPNETLARALRELREKNLIIQSRHHLRGVDGAKPALYALTWLRIDPCPSKGLNIGDTLHAPRSLS
jgi:hypothetical protein